MRSGNFIKGQQAAQFSSVTLCNFPRSFLLSLLPGNFPCGQSAPSNATVGLKSGCEGPREDVVRSLHP